VTARADGSRKSILRGLLLLICLCAAGPCMAMRHALLVGVSEYPGLSPQLQLKAPANDVAPHVPPEVQEGEKRRDSDDRDDGGFDEAGV